jgi:alanine dehydrogenase
MDFGIPKEVREGEYRVGLTPAGAHALVDAGHRVYIERDAGSGAGFTDENYRSVGAEIVYSAEEAFGRAQVITKVTRLKETEYAFLRSGQTILSFLHLAVASRDLAESLEEHRTTAIAYETIQTENGMLPVLAPTSQVAGCLAPMIAGQCLQSVHGGRGILLSGIAGVPPAAVAILGAGVVGTSAARAFLGIGAQVTLLDSDYTRLDICDRQFRGRVVTLMATPYNIERVVKFADVVIGAILVPGQRSPIVLPGKLLKTMRSRAVFVDFAIDQGGCAETSRPMTLSDPTFVVESVIHYCVPNVPALVARTASHALTNAALGYLLQIGEKGVEGAIENDNTLRRGAQVLNGKILS